MCACSSHMGEARGPVITFHCDKDEDCVGEKCFEAVRAKAFSPPQHQGRKAR
ncbi:unnamed protein product [Dovyalis caffra]|uniref:Uncharacterized protein n=1 Tax=Dovyalis caffra TaxID=77055 RepID=A0AAV1SAR5_9ROSI|nr:unnamed protein product [Dovyalis caffra]